MKAMGIYAALAVAVGACAYKAEPLTAPAYDVVTSYGAKLPGKWLLLVDTAALDRPLKPSTYYCSAHHFPIALSGSFRTSVQQTLANVVDALETVDGPMNAGQVAARGAQGLIVVRGVEVRPRIEAKPGFWTGTMEGSVLVVASVSVDGPRGRLYGQTFEGQGFAGGDAGFMCSGGSQALADAATQATRDTVRKIAEGVSNSERIRAGG